MRQSAICRTRRPALRFRLDGIVSEQNTETLTSSRCQVQAQSSLNPFGAGTLS